MAIFLSDALKKAAANARGFLSATEIKDQIRLSKNYNRDSSDPSRAGALLIFSTSNQQTWLVATANRLYCILDDVRKPEPHINWSMGKGRLVGDGGELLIEPRSRDHTDRTGYVDIGDNHKDWLFSRSLFSDEKVEDRITGLIRSQMGG